MQNRLLHLEGLVKGAMASQPLDEHRPAGTPLPNENIEKDNSGRLIGPNGATYIGTIHWATMLEDIEEVKNYFSEDVDEHSLDEESTRSGISLLLNHTGSPKTHHDLLVALPDRNIVNRLVSRYFNSNSPALHIIHKPTFQKN
ncbi:uncharacterized protein BHQ10_005329 [Talaromyces amestolkiae]|uniref:Uncharacterized protein n=1 Tax=Talaromyces amestolkiae TaxID=1196081 RepID=A0A364L0H2_TALAM|nr:uncharacterized protein BHQ10_005329 [Talaromyces amestolkiae]RAO69317.1 hypothetical protein BHQ10_005329 [Talaromyces amestolkiae]